MRPEGQRAATPHTEDEEICIGIFFLVCLIQSLWIPIEKTFFCIFFQIFWGLVPGFVSWVLGIVRWVLGIVFWVLGIVFWVLGIVFRVTFRSSGLDSCRDSTSRAPAPFSEILDCNSMAVEPQETSAKEKGLEPHVDMQADRIE